MKILHICMVDAYSEGWTYHRNVMSEKNKMDGHDVTIITTKYRMANDGSNELDCSGIFFTKSGIKIVRLPDVLPNIPSYMQERMHWTKNLYKAISDEIPDIIMVHNLQFVNLSVITKYRRKHPTVRLLGDTHADRFVAIGKNKKKSVFVHKYIWRPVIQKNFRYFDRFFYIGFEQKKFFENMYEIDLSEATFAPLPAPIVSREEKQRIRSLIRKKHELSDGELLFVHSGKLTRRKKTRELLKALSHSNLYCRLVIIGDIPKEQKRMLFELINLEPRVEYLGWKSGDELREYLAAADLYLQPGTMSVTMQNALCAGTPVMIYPHESYQYYCNGCEFQVKNTADIKSVYDRLIDEKGLLTDMMSKAYEVAEKYFSIEKAAKLIYEMGENE